MNYEVDLSLIGGTWSFDQIVVLLDSSTGQKPYDVENLRKTKL